MKLEKVRYKDLENYKQIFKETKKLKEEFFGSAPSPFIGRFGYPHVNVGILSPQETKKDAWLYDAPKHWARKNFSISKVLGLRSGLVNSRQKADVKNRDKIVEISQEVGLSSKPVDIEVKLKRKPRFVKESDAIITPMGPRGDIKKVRVTENPKISSKVWKVVDDVDLKANKALSYLYSKSFDENFLSRVLSVGSLGVKDQRKLVPTRWSITAVDDTLGKKRIKVIKDYNESDYQIYFDGHLGNYYLVMFFPEKWSYELFETYLPSWTKSKTAKYSTDYEFYEGRKDYATNTAGGYYAARLPIAEKLSKMKRQAGVLALRFITEEYKVGLGVWVCREATRKSLKAKPIKFASRELMLEYARGFIKKKFGFDLDILLKKSKVLKEIKTQRKIGDF